MTIIIDDTSLEELISSQDTDTLKRAFGHMANALEECSLDPVDCL